MLSRHCAGDAWRAPFLQQRRGKRPRSSASQQVAPTSQPSPAELVPHGFRSCLGFGLGQSTQEVAVSSDHLPPTSAASTTKRARPLLTLDKSSPSSVVRLPEQDRCGSAFFVSAVPSRLRGDTNVVSMASWAPSKRVNPSTTISTLRASVGFPPSMSRFLTMTFVETRLPPSLQTWAANPFQCETPGSTPPPPSPPRTVLDGGHGSRGDGRYGRRKASGRWRRRHNKTRNGCGSIRVDRDVGKAMNALHASGPFCRPPQCPLRARQRRPNCPLHSVFVCGSRCRFLPTMFWLNRVFVVLTLSRAQPSPHGFPSWDFELGFPQSVLTLPNHCETRAIVVHDHDLCHLLVPLLHTGNAIGPTGPMASLDTPCSQTQSLPSSRGLQLLCEHFLSHLPPSQPIVVGLRESLGQWGSHHAQMDINSWCRTEQKEPPRALEIPHRWNPVQQSRVFGDCHIQLGSDELDGGFRWTAPRTGVKPPNHCLRIHNSCSGGQPLQTCWLLPRTIPHPRLAVEDLDLSLRPQLRSQNVDNCLDPLRKAHHANVLQESENGF